MTTHPGAAPGPSRRGPAFRRRRPRPAQSRAPDPDLPVASARFLRLDRLALVVVLGLVTGGLGFAVTLLYGGRIPLAVCLAAGLLGAMGWAILDVLPADDVGDLLPTMPPTPDHRIGFADLHGLESLIGAAVNDQDRFDERVRPLLAGLATDLLRRRGLHWPAHRERIRQAVSPGVWTLLTVAPGAVAAGAGQVEAGVGELEALAATQDAR